MDNLTDEQIKQIVKDICDEEKREHGLDTQIYVITPSEHYDKLKTKKMKLSREEFITPILSAGNFHSGYDEIIIYNNKLKKIKKTERKIFRLIFICYHELKHAQQNQMSDFSYDKFIKRIQNNAAPNFLIDYHWNHDKYYYEIDANMYAIQKTKEYMKQKYPKEYEKLKDELDKIEKKTKFNYIMHDASDIIERLIDEIKRFLKETNGTKISNMDEISPVLSIFLNEDLSYKSVSEIINNENFKKLDKRIIYAFFSSETFLKTLNYDELSNEEIELLSESLEYTHNLYQKQVDMALQEKELTSISSLKDIKSKILKLTKKILNLEIRFLHNIEHPENPLRTEEQRQEHMKSIPEKLEKIREISNKRRRGYITTNAFYIAGLLLSVSTIIYLLLK